MCTNLEFFKTLRFTASYSSEGTKTVNYESIRSLCNATMSVSIKASMEIHMEPSDHIDYFKGKDCADDGVK